MRLFIAILLDREAIRRLSDTQETFRVMGARGNYTARENLHLTLAFIGEYDDPERVLRAMRTVRFEPFTVTLDRVGSFGNIWWAGISGSRPLEIMAGKLRNALDAEGIPFDRKPFRPHITLLRKAEFTRGEPGRVTIEPCASPVKRISLMLSERGRDGMVYTEIGSAP